MKLTITLLFNFILSFCYAQESEREKKWLDSILNQREVSKVERKAIYHKYDFDKLYLDKNPVYGFIGQNYTRLFMKFKTVVKDSKMPNMYYVTGESRVKTNLIAFKGKIKISGIRLYHVMHWGVDDEYKIKGIKAEGLIFGSYNLSENPAIVHSGKFSGVTVSYFYIDKNNNVKYDNIEPSDSGNNNQFVGTWQSYSGKTTKVCNWGDYRIPLSGDLDIGAGDFAVNPKYKKFGWQNFKY